VIGGTKFGCVCEVSQSTLIADLQARRSYHDKHRVDATLANGWSTIQSVYALPTLSKAFLHDQLGHRTVAQVNVHVRRGGQLTAIEFFKSHFVASWFVYVQSHRHDRDWSTKLIVRLLGGSTSA
jgi:hypothetical protein